MVFNSKTWVDVPDEQNPPAGAVATEAAEFNRLETGVADAHAHMAEALAAHGGALVYVEASTAPPANPPTGLLWYQTDGIKRLLSNEGTSAAPVWVDVTRDKLVAADLVSDYVISGLLPAVPTPESLTATVPAGEAYVMGRRVAKVGESLTFAKASDTYVDLTNEGVYVLAAVANGGAEPALTTNAIRLFVAVTDADVAQQERISIDTIADDTVYTARINDVDVSYTSGTSATASSISLGLTDTINASTDPNVEVVTAIDEAGTLLVTADTAGVPFTLTVTANMSITTVTTNNTAHITTVTDRRQTSPQLQGAPKNPLRHLTADPASPADGESWVRSDLTPPDIRTRKGGVTYRVAMVAV